MLDLGAFGEFFIIVVAVLVLFGPKEIPDVLRHVGKWVGRFRALSREIQKNIDALVTHAEIEAYKKKAEEPFQPSLKKNMRKISKKSSSRSKTPS